MFESKLTTYSEQLFIDFSVYFSPYLNKVGISKRALVDPCIKIPSESYIKLFELAASDGRPDFGLIIGQQVKYKQFGIFGYAVKNASNLKGFLDTLVDYKVIFSQGPDLYWSLKGNQIEIHYPIKSPDKLSYRQHIEYVFAIILTTMSAYVGYSLKPNKVCFFHEKPKSLRIHNSIFGACTQFNQAENKMCFNADILNICSPHADPRLLAGLRPYLDQQKNNRRVNELELRLKNIISPELHTGDISIQWVSRELGINVRTLQRHLDDLDLNFSYILTNIRKQLAIEYISKQDCSIFEVAQLLGFKESSSFTRAFKRWNGKTPNEYRASIR